MTSFYLGKATRIPGKHFGDDEQYSYEYFENIYKVGGTYESAPWDLHDRMVRKIKVITSEDPLRVERMHVKVHFTLVAFDFETTTDGEFHDPYMCSIAFYRNREGQPFSFRELRVIYEELPEHHGATIDRKSFFGKDCGQQMVDYVIQNFKHVMVLMVAFPK